MRILLDLQAYQAQNSQCDETTEPRSILLALAIARWSHHHEIWILLNDRFPESIPAIRQTFSGLVPRQCIVAFSIPANVAACKSDRVWITCASELLREFFIASLNPDIIYISRLFDGAWDKDIVTSVKKLPGIHMPASLLLHDSDLSFLFESNSNLRNQLFENYRLQKINLLKRCDLILTLSEHSRRAVIDNLDKLPSKVINVFSENSVRNFEQSATASRSSWDSAARKSIEAFESLVARLPRQKTQAFDSPSFERIYQTLIYEVSRISGISGKRDADLSELVSSIAINRSFQEKQLLVDISEFVLRDARTGIQRVVRSVLIQLLRYPPKSYTVVPIYWDGARYRQANRFVSQLLPDLSSLLEKGMPVDRAIDISCNDIFLGLDLTSNLISIVQDTLKRFRNLGVEIYFIVHDILLVHHPEWWPSGYDVIFRRWLETIAELSTGFVCVSQTTAEAVKDWLLYFPPRRIDALQVSYFHLGADIEESLPSCGLPENAEVVLRKLKTTLTILMVATIEPRKGYAQALDAFTLLWREGIKLNLVIVGKRGWYVENLVKQLRTHPERNKQLFWLEGISDEYLTALYSVSTALLTASEGEGFGLPLIEAAQRQLPIIARDLPVFREVAGNHAFYFGGKQPEQLAAAVKRWLALYRKDDIPRSVGMPWLTWAESTQQLLNAILP